MSANKSSLELLKTISGLIGMDIRAFFTATDLSNPNVGSRGSSDCPPLPLGRLIAAFRALPSPESRERALLMLEALAAEVRGGGGERAR